MINRWQSNVQKARRFVTSWFLRAAGLQEEQNDQDGRKEIFHKKLFRTKLSCGTQILCSFIEKPNTATDPIQVFIIVNANHFSFAEPYQVNGELWAFFII